MNIVPICIAVTQDDLKRCRIRFDVKGLRRPRSSGYKHLAVRPILWKCRKQT